MSESERDPNHREDELLKTDCLIKKTLEIKFLHLFILVYLGLQESL